MHRLAVILALTVAAVSCTRPSSYEHFVPVSQDSLYVFKLNMPDSTCRYDISFYTRIEGTPLSKRGFMDPLELRLLWTSPTLRQFAETVYMDPGTSKGVSCQYRKGLSPRETGEWQLTVKVNNQPASLRGMGVVCSENREQWDTTN